MAPSLIFEFSYKGIIFPANIIKIWGTQATIKAGESVLPCSQTLYFLFKARRPVENSCVEVRGLLSNGTTLTVRKFRRLAVQSSVWTERKYWREPCEQSAREIVQPVKNSSCDWWM